jgi:hypothetical protein
VHHFQNGLAALKSARAAASELRGLRLLRSGYQGGDKSASAQQLGTCVILPIQRFEVELFVHRDIVEGAPRLSWIRFAAFRNAIRRLADFLLGKTFDEGSMWSSSLLKNLESGAFSVFLPGPRVGQSARVRFLATAGRVAGYATSSLGMRIRS